MSMKLFFTLTLVFLFIIFFGICSADDEFFKRGLQYYQNSEFQLATAHFEEAKKANPRESLIYFYLGNSYYQLNDLDNAILNFTAGLNFTEQKGIYFYNLGNCYFLKRNYDFAAEMYSKALMNDPTLYDSYLNSGNAYYKLGDYPNTIVQWETYLKVYPETPQYVKIEKAIAYLKGELSGPSSGTSEEKKGIDEELLSDVLSDLEELINRTENVMETSEAPIDDLRSEEIER
jgi:tetratricopeptide (TPR) repeat protein